jgi:hypothetical protein
MAGTPLIEGPEDLTATYTTDIYFPPANTYALVRHIHLANTDSSARTVRIYRDATGTATDGKQLAYDYSVAANDVADIYFPSGLKLTSSIGLVGGASSGSVVTITILGELYAS